MTPNADSDTHDFFEMLAEEGVVDLDSRRGYVGHGFDGFGRKNTEN